MRHCLMLLVMCSALAQQSPTPAPALSRGAEILTELQTKVDAHKAKTGDEVRMKVLRAVLAQGQIAIPEGAIIVGHVTKVSPRGDAQAESRIAVKIDRAEWKHGSVPLDAVIVRHGVTVRKIIRQPAGIRPGDTPEGDMLAAMGRNSQRPPSTATVTTTTMSTQTPKTPGNPTPPPAAPPNPPTSPPPLPPAPSAPQTMPPPATKPPETATETRNKIESRYAADVLRVEGPRAVDVTVRPSADPNAGTELTSKSREVILSKGVLLVLRTVGTGQP